MKRLNMIASRWLPSYLANKVEGLINTYTSTKDKIDAWMKAWEKRDPIWYFLFSPFVKLGIFVVLFVLFPGTITFSLGLSAWANAILTGSVPIV